MKNKQIYNNRSYSPIRITEDGDIELVLSKYAENIPISELQLLNNCNVLSDTIPRDTNFFYSLWFSDPQTEKLLFSETCEKLAFRPRCPVRPPSRLPRCAPRISHGHMGPRSPSVSLQLYLQSDRKHPK